MDQYETPEQLTENKSADEFEEIQKFLEQATQQMSNQQQLCNLQNKIIVFLIGNSRVGKSTLFHLLQGDKLKKYKKKLTLSIEGITSYIGHIGISFTKKLNIFAKQESEIIFIDTPGFYDTNDGYDEVISQINLAKMLNQCKKEKCKDILFLTVAIHNENNYNELQETIMRLKESFSEQVLPYFLNKFCLVITKSDGERDEMNESMETIFQHIISNNKSFQNDPIIAHLQRHKEQILYFPEVANEIQQETLFKEIHDFIQKTQEEESTQTKLQFFMTISDKGSNKLRIFLEKLKQFYHNELIKAYDSLISQINQINDVGQQFRICKCIQNIQEEPLYYNKIQRFLEKFNKIHEVFNLKLRSQDRVKKAEVLFLDGWIETIFQFETQKRYFNHSLSLHMSHNYDQIIRLSINFAEQLEQTFKLKNKDNAQMFKQMMEITKNLQNENCKESVKLVVVIGNRKVGKSTAINLIYNNEFLLGQNIYQSKILDQSEEFNPDLLAMSVYNKDVVIEFQELNFNNLAFLQYLYQATIDQHKQFQLLLILDYKSRHNSDVSQALLKLIKMNNCQNSLKLFIIANIKTGQTCPENLLEYLPENFAHSNSKIFKICLQNNEFVIDEKTFETSTFDIQPSERIIQFPEENLICSFKNFMNELFFQFQQKIDVYQGRMWEKTKQISEFKNLIVLSQLQPNSEDYEQKIKLQASEFGVQIINLENRYDQLQEFHKKLIEQKQIIELTITSLDHIQRAKIVLENLCFQIIQEERYNLRLHIQIILEITQNFPIYLENEMELFEKIQFLNIVAAKLYPEISNQIYLSNLPSQQIQRIKWQLQSQRHPNQEILNLVWQLLQQVNSEFRKLQQLLQLIYASQSENFRYTDSSFFVKIYFSFLSIFETNKFEEFQKQLNPKIKQYEDIKIYESLEKMI